MIELDFESLEARQRWVDALGSLRLPTVAEPRCARRDSADVEGQHGRGWQLVIAGTEPEAFERPGIAERLHGMIGFELRLIGRTWRSQSRFVAPLIREFLSEPGHLLNVVTVINRRRPFLRRDGSGRVQRAQPNGIRDRGRLSDVRRTGLDFGSADCRLTPELATAVSWHDEYRSATVVGTELLREYGPVSVVEHRLALCRDGDDRERMRTGDIPALRRESLVCDSVTDAPIVSLWRLGRAQEIDLVCFEVHPESGAVLDFRWSQQPLEYHLTADLNNIHALLLALREGERI